MIKRVIITLAIFMMVISAAYAQNSNINKHRELPLNPYEIGVDKVVNVPELMDIKYKNVFVSKGKAKLVGEVIVPLKYKIVTLNIEYYIIDRNQEYANIVQLDLIKGVAPNTFNFEVIYPLDLSKSEFELFVVEFWDETKKTQSL